MSFPPCPICNSQYTYENKKIFNCSECAHEWIQEDLVISESINYDTWIKLVESGDVFFDSGMYQGNIRPYSQWRATNSFWNKLIVSRY